MTAVAMFPTVFSTEAFSFLSVITDKKDYRRKNVIGNSVKDFQNTPTVRHLLSLFC